MRGRSAPQTPEQIAQFGHIAAALRAVATKHGWSTPDVAQRLGFDRSYAPVWVWMAGKGAPGPKAREKISKVLGIPADDLKKRELEFATVKQPTSRAVAVIDAPRPVARVPGGDVLSFTVDRTGMARIKVDATLPLDKATPLFRMLLDAGLVFGETIDE